MRGIGAIKKLPHCPSQKDFRPVTNYYMAYRPDVRSPDFLGLLHHILNDVKPIASSPSLSFSLCNGGIGCGGLWPGVSAG